MAESVGGFDVTVEQVDGYELRVRFNKEGQADLLMDEPPPLGKDHAPNPSRILASAVVGCLSASLMFCLSRAGTKLTGMKAKAHVDLVRNDQKRLRIGKVSVTLMPPLAAGDPALQKCLATFEDFCTVTQSVRQGLDIDVRVEPTG